MLNEILELEGLGEIFAPVEGLTADDSAVLESMDIESFDDSEYLSEVDEARIDETSEIMAEVFSKDVIANWSELSLDEKTEKINEYYVKAGENLGINTKGVIVEYMPSEPGTISYGYNAGDGYIHLNATVVNDPEMLGQVLDTATHEMRHQFQTDVLANPSNFSDLPNAAVETWDYEFKNYISPDYDFQGYYEQAIECDARDFAEDVLNSYVEKMNLN